MNKQRVEKALKVIQEEINTETLSSDMAVYQVYCTMNSFFAEWAKTNILTKEGYEENKKTLDILLDFIHALTTCMGRYSETVTRMEDDDRQN